MALNSLLSRSSQGLLLFLLCLARFLLSFALMNESTRVMMKKRYLRQTANFLLIASCFLLTAHHAQAQREVQYAQYLVNPLAINPAATGVRETFHFNAVLRRQFVAGVKWMPITQSFAMDGNCLLSTPKCV